MADGEMAKWLATLGVGGVLAGVIFYFYQKHASEWAKRLEGFIDLERHRTDALIRVVSENTASNSAVIKAVESNTKMLDMLCQQVWDNGGRRQHLRAISETRSRDHDEGT